MPRRGLRVSLLFLLLSSSSSSQSQLGRCAQGLTGGLSIAQPTLTSALSKAHSLSVCCARGRWKMLWMQGQRCSASRPSFSSLQGEKVPGGCQGFPVRQGGRSHRGWQSPGWYPYEAGKGCAEAISSLPSAAKPGTEGSPGRQSPNAASGKAERHQGAPEHPPPSHLAHRQTEREGERRPEDTAARVLPGEGMPGAIRPAPRGGPGPAGVWGRYLMAAMASTACRHITASALRGASFCRSTWGGRARPG